MSRVAPRLNGKSPGVDKSRPGTDAEDAEKSNVSEGITMEQLVVVLQVFALISELQLPFPPAVQRYCGPMHF